MSLTIHCKYKYFDSIVQRAEDSRKKIHFCRLPFAVNVMLNLSNGCQKKSPLEEPEMKFSFFIFKPPVRY